MQLKGIFPVLKGNSCGEFWEKSVKEQLEKMKQCSSSVGITLQKAVEREQRQYLLCSTVHWWDLKSGSFQSVAAAAPRFPDSWAQLELAETFLLPYCTALNHSPLQCTASNQSSTVAPLHSATTIKQCKVHWHVSQCKVADWCSAVVLSERSLFTF